MVPRFWDKRTHYVLLTPHFDAGMSPDRYQSISALARGLAHPPQLAAFEEGMTLDSVLVAVVDDDESVRESLPDLLKELGFATRVFASAEEFLASGGIEATGCLILDVAMPGMSGPELQRELTRRGERVPVIFITAQPIETARSALLAEGAVECLFKPFSEHQLCSALTMALE
jgi:FixJ family two-component response regulator